MASGGQRSNSSPALSNGSVAEALFNSHGSWLLASLRRRYGPDLAEDLLQETYLRILRQAGPAPILKPRAFLLQIARNLFLDGYRRDARRVERDAHNPDARAQTQAATQLETVVVKQIILTMPPKLRDVFVLSRFVGMTQAAIADHLGIRQKTVESRMAQALVYLATRLRE